MTQTTALSSVLFTGGQLLRAAAEPGTPDDRIREGLLVPWNEDGRTNLGRGFPVRPEFAAHLAADAKVVGIYGHNREAAVSRLVAHAATPQGLWGRVFINRTALGDQLLAEIDGGARDGLSIEASDLVLDEAGGVVGGRLDFFAHVPVGAYDSARAVALAATVPLTGVPPVTFPHHGQTAQAPAATPVLQAQVPAGTPAPVAGQWTPPVATQPAPAAAPAQPATQPAPAVAEPAAQPAGLDVAGLQTLLAGLQQFSHLVNVAPAGQPAAPAGAPSATMLLGQPQVPAQQQQGPGSVDPVQYAATLQAGLANSPGDQTLMAALQDITHSGLPMFQRPAGTIGEQLWEGTKDSTRPWCDLMRSKPLTSMKGTSWQWTRGPEVKAWSGDKAEVPSNQVSLEEVPWTARRAAGGWDIDRAYLDFGTPDFWTEFYSEQTRSYRELTNEWAAEFLVAQARDVSVDGNVPDSYLTLDRTIDAGPTQVLKAAALGTAILEDTPRVKQGPDWIAMNTLDWLTMADLTALDLPAFLALLKVDPSRFMRTSLVPRGEVILGVTNATTFRELGGGAPIRVDALDVARGGIDSAVYGYAGYSHDRPGGVISVPLAPAA